ncbi:transposase [Escherichia albertii]|nr:transposase [Escherichia coli]
MERFFRSLKNEGITVGGLRKLQRGSHAITDYIAGYYSAPGPHEITDSYLQTNRKINTEKI